MNRKHYSPNHPAVQAWTGNKKQAKQRGKLMEPHLQAWQQSHYHELSLAERRQAVVARAGGKPDRRVRHEALLGLVSIIASGFVFDHAETAGGDWWLLVGILLAGGGVLLVDAIRRATE